MRDSEIAKEKEQTTEWRRKAEKENKERRSKANKTTAITKQNKTKSYRQYVSVVSGVKEQQCNMGQRDAADVDGDG